MVTVNVPQSLIAGDSASWLDDAITLADGRRADSSAWTLRYSLRGPTQLDLTASASGSGWKTALSASASSVLTAGDYAWVAILSRQTERFTVGQGRVTVQLDITTVTTAWDGRSAAQKALADCEAALADVSVSGLRTKKYKIANREREFSTIAELLQLRDFWKLKVMAEGTAQSLANGHGNPRNLYVRFQRP